MDLRRGGANEECRRFRASPAPRASDPVVHGSIPWSGVDKANGGVHDMADDVTPGGPRKRLPGSLGRPPRVGPGRESHAQPTWNQLTTNWNVGG